MAQAMRKKISRKRKARWTLERLVSALGAPQILVTNTYYWSGFYGNATARHRKALKYVKEVAEWLHRLNKEYNLGLDIRVDEDSPSVTAYHNGEKVFYFHINSSRANVYKRQNVRGLLGLLNRRL